MVAGCRKEELVKMVAYLQAERSDGDQNKNY
jgi:hypothetical protein